MRMIQSIISLHPYLEHIWIVKHSFNFIEGDAPKKCQTNQHEPHSSTKYHTHPDKSSRARVCGYMGGAERVPLPGDPAEALLARGVPHLEVLALFQRLAPSPAPPPGPTPPPAGTAGSRCSPVTGDPGSGRCGGGACSAGRGPASSLRRAARISLQSRSSLARCVRAKAWTDIMSLGTYVSRQLHSAQGSFLRNLIEDVTA